MDTSCCNYITNGEFDEVNFPTQIDEIWGIINSNWWNNAIIDGDWVCYHANENASFLPSLFSFQAYPNFQVPTNLFSDNQSIPDPSGDGNYAAINLYDRPGDIYDNRNYLEQELSDFLYPEFTYELSYYTRRAPITSYTSNIGVYFTDTILFEFDLSQIGSINSLYTHYTPNPNGSWTQTLDLITIPIDVDPLNYITIGQSVNDPQTFIPGTQQYISEELGIYYIDSIYIKLVNAPDTVIFDTICGIDNTFELLALKPHRCAKWEVDSGPAVLIDSTYIEASFYHQWPGDYVIKYSFQCDTTVYTETYNLHVLDSLILMDTIEVCSQNVNLSEYTSGLTGEWETLNSGYVYAQGNIDFFAGFDIGYNNLLFTPDTGQGDCIQTDYLVTVYYNPFPKETEGNNDVWNDIVTDNQGNVYVVGTYYNESLIDGNFIDNGISSAADREQFMVAKYDSCGALLWYTWGIGACDSYNKGRSTGTSIEIDEYYNRVYITGKSKGMVLAFSDTIGYYEEVLNFPGSPQPSCLDDSDVAAYIMELNSETGRFEDFNNHLVGITTINSISVAQDGPFKHFVYLGGISEYSNIPTSVLAKLETNQDYNDYQNLDQPNSPLIAGSNFDNSINDTYYKDQFVYTVGTTSGPLSFESGQVNANLINGSTTSWTAKVYDGPNGFNTISIGNGGDSYVPFQRIMTGEQIYVNNHDQIIIAGKYSGYIGGAYSGLFDNESPSLYTQPSVTDVYIFKLFQGGPNLILQGNPQNTDFISAEIGTPELSKISMTGEKDNIYIYQLHTQVKNCILKVQM